MSDSTHISETVSAGQLRAFIERIERVEEEIKTLNGDKSEIYKELRGCGFDVKAVRQCVAARKLDSAEREERNAIFDLYWAALTGASRVHVHEARESPTPKSSNSKASSVETAELVTTPHDPETGEITEHEQPETVTQSTTEEGESDAKSVIDRRRQDGAGERSQSPITHKNAPAESATDAISAPHSNPQPFPSPEADKPEAVSPPAVSGAYFRPLNPDCRKAARGEQCALMHSQALCSKCQQVKDAGRVAA